MASVNSVIKSLGYAVKQSDDVVKATAKKADLGTFIKNSVNVLKSNEGMATKTVSKQGRQAARQAVENLSTKQAYQTTTKKVLNNFNMSDATDTTKKVANTKIKTRPDTSKIREISDNIANSKRTQGVIDGHNARARQTAMDTMVNNVKDSRSTLDIPEGPSRNRAEKINQTVNNIKNGPQREVPPFLDPWDLSWNEWTEVGNKKLTMHMDDAPYAERVIDEINNGRPSTGPKYGPRKDSIPNDDGPFQNNFDFRDEGPKANSSGSGGGNNKNTNTNSGPQDGPNSGGGNEGPNDRRSWKDYANDYFGGIGDTYRSVKDGGNFWDALQSAHTNEDGSLRWGRIAGTYAAAAVGSRVISGGGLYKDRYGNSNIPGVPFI